MRGTASGPVLNSAYRKQHISVSGTLGVRQLGCLRNVNSAISPSHPAPRAHHYRAPEKHEDQIECRSMLGLVRSARAYVDFFGAPHLIQVDVHRWETQRE
ncbi:hypothetical protein NDU88_002812 [Pleurodeles waltl]|uniref:Uncharacterized protein n=1 Tax=Pleurodeles waltl TaxID=8319 RepID=A0AAV7RB26_PLEWA|nr:hypothetical protein NDU88_002812 [Pleurodeles waltl]